MDSKIGTDLITNIDAVDSAIIDFLRTDGRMAFTQIADELHVSPGMIRQRYNRLVDEGYLKVVAITDPIRRGVKTMALVGLRTDGNRMLEAADRDGTLDQVFYLVLVKYRFNHVAD